jgi:hypothetical protein
MFTIVLVSTTWKGKRTLKTRGTATTRKAAEQIQRQLSEKSDALYKVLGPVQLRKLQAEIAAETAARRKAGARKAAAKRAASGTNFILCPNCKAKSKRLYSEMGGLQTRRCQNGHIFTFDSMVANPASWNRTIELLHVYGLAR